MSQTLCQSDAIIDFDLQTPLSRLLVQQTDTVITVPLSISSQVSPGVILFCCASYTKCLSTFTCGGIC